MNRYFTWCELKWVQCSPMMLSEHNVEKMKGSAHRKRWHLSICVNGKLGLIYTYSQHHYIFVSGTFDLSDVTCKKRHRIALSPFLYCMKNGDNDDMCKQECIPVGCLPPSALAVGWGGGVWLSACWDTSPLGVGWESPPPGCGPGDLQGILGYHPSPPPPREQNSWHTLLKILPYPNFFAGGNKNILFCCWWCSSLFTDTRPRRQRCRCGGWLTSPSCSNCTRSPTRLTTPPNETSITTTPGSTTQALWWVATSWYIIHKQVIHRSKPMC